MSAREATPEEIADLRRFMATWDAVVVVACATSACGGTVPRVGDRCVRCLNRAGEGPRPTGGGRGPSGAAMPTYAATSRRRERR